MCNILIHRTRRIWDEAKKLCAEIDAKSAGKKDKTLGTCRRLSKSPSAAEALGSCKKGVYTPEKVEADDLGACKKGVYTPEQKLGDDLGTCKKGVYTPQSDGGGDEEGDMSGEGEDLGGGDLDGTPLFLRCDEP